MFSRLFWPRDPSNKKTQSPVGGFSRLVAAWLRCFFPKRPVHLSPDIIHLRIFRLQAPSWIDLMLDCGARFTVLNHRFVSLYSASAVRRILVLDEFGVSSPTVRAAVAFGICLGAVFPLRLNSWDIIAALNMLHTVGHWSQCNRLPYPAFNFLFSILFAAPSSCHLRNALTR